MGASVGAAAVAAGGDACWASQGRGQATGRRAAEARLRDVGTIEAVCDQCDVIVSVCPPAAAEEVATGVAGRGFGGVFVDANAVAPHTARRVGEIVVSAGARFVDGGLIGPPAHRAGTTRFYLSGSDAPSVAALFAGGPLEAVVVEGGAGGASALKMCYAAWTKGSAALLIGVRALAGSARVEEPLLAEWARSQPGLEARSEAALSGNAHKAWRFAGEMREIAATFEEASLPGGFHSAAADVYDRLREYKDRAPPPPMAEAIGTLLESGR